jgi:hypothetical protein
MTLEDFQELANTLYHEARHTEQFYRIAQIHAGTGALESGLPTRTGRGVSRDIVKMAYNKPVRRSVSGKPFFEAIERSYTNHDYRNTILRKLLTLDPEVRNSPAFQSIYRDYRNLAEELDAWRTADKVSNMWPRKKRLPPFE